MAAITIVRARENWKPGHKVFRGTGSMNSTDASGTLAVPKGNVIGFRAHSIGSTTVETFGLVSSPTTGLIVPTAGSGLQYLTVARSSNGSGLNFFFEVEFDSH